MRLSCVQAVLAATFATTSAFRDLSFPSTAAADTDVQLQITNDLSSSSGFDKQFDSFRVYLTTTLPGLSAFAACYLVQTSPINTTELTFQRPGTVGPEGDAYSIATEEYNEDDFAANPSSYEYSSTFALTNATGSWSEFELAGNKIGDADVVPCTAYDCARNCSQTFYPNNFNTTEGFKSTYNCIAACPGVDLEVDDTSGGNSSSPTGTASTTILSGTVMPTTTTRSATPTSSNGAGQQILGTTPGFVAILLGVLGVFGL
jgi:hypothetical protein